MQKGNDGKETSNPERLASGSETDKYKIPILMREGVVYHGSDGSIIYANPPARKLLGLPPGQAERGFADVLRGRLVSEQGDDLPVDEIPALAALASGKPIRHGVFGLVDAPSGQTTWVLSSAEPEFRDGGHLPFQVIATYSDITPRKEAEQTLEASLNSYRIIADNTYHWEYWLAPDGSGIYHSPSCKRTSGFDSDRFLADKNLIQKIIHPDDRATYNKHYETLAEQKESCAIAFRIVTATGEIRHIEQVCQSLFDNTGMFLGYRGTNLDVTEKKAAEERFRKNNEIQQLMTSISAEYTHLPRQEFDRATRRFLAGIGTLTGAQSIDVYAHDPERGIMVRTYQWFAGGDGPMLCGHREIHLGRVPNWFSTLLPGKILEFSEIKDLPPDHELFTILESREVKSQLTVPIMDGESGLGFLSLEFGKDGSVCSPAEKELLLHFARMLTDAKKRYALEEQIREGERRLGVLIKNLRGVVFRCANNRHGTMNFISGGVLELTGFDPADFIGNRVRTFDSIIHEDDQDRVWQEIQDGLAKNNEYTIEYRIVTSDRSEKWVWEKGLGVLDNGRRIALEGFISDVTIWKLRQTEYKQLINAMNDGVVVIGQDGNYLEVNDKAVTASGYSRMELLSMGPADLDICMGRDEIRENLRKISTTDQRTVFETEHRTRDGRRLPLEVSACPVTYQGKRAVLSVERDITDRKEVEKKLVRREQNYRNLFFNSPNAYLILAEGRFIDCNRAAATLLGCDCAHIIGKQPHDISPEFQPEGRRSEAYAQDLLAAIHRKRSSCFEWVHQRYDGTTFLAVVTLTVMSYDDRDVLLVNWQDVTGQREAGLQLKKLSRVVEQSPSIIVITDPEGIIEYVNTSFEKVTGYSAAEAVGQNPRILKSGQHDHLFYKALWTTITAGETWQGELCNRKKNGVLYWESVVISPIFSENGVITHYVASKEDITETRKIRKQIQENEERMRAITDSAQDAIIMMDPEGRISFWNPAAGRILGYAGEEVLGKDLHRLLTPGRYLPQFQSAFPRFLKSGQGGAVGRILELETLRKDGTEVPVELSLSGIQFENGWHAVAVMRDITQRKQAEEELRKFRTVSDQAQHGNVIATTDGILIYSNEAFAGMHGYRAEEIVGRHLSMLHNQEQMASVRDSIATLQEKGGFSGLEIWRKRKDGTTFPSLMNASLIRDDRGTAIYMSASVTDITDIKQKEAALAASEERLNSAQKMARMGSWEVEYPKGKAVWSENFYNLLDMDPSQTPPDRDGFVQFINPEDRSLLYREFKRMKQTGKSAEITLRLTTIAGRTRWVRSSMVPRMEAGDLAGIVGVSIDVTDQVQRENEIRKLTLAIEQSPIALQVIGTDRNIVYVNPAFTRITGYDAGEVIGRSTQLLQSDLEDKSLHDKMWETVASGSTWTGEWMGQKKNGGRYPESISISPVYNERKEIISFLAIQEDITLERKAEQERIARKAAEATSLAKSTFLSSMSHEIRTPLNAIFGLNKLLLRTKLDMKQMDYVRKIDLSTENLLGIINDILDFSKIEAGKIEIEHAEFSLNEVLESLSVMMNVKAEEKDLELIVFKKKEVPDYLIGDSVRLGQVLINLSTNAIKFTQKGEVLITIQTVSRDDDGIVLSFSVQDTGIGLSPNQIDKLFESFQQADSSTTRRFGGTGLGLAISKRLVELMGGQISLKSEPGRGSTFSFTARFEVPAVSGIREPAVPAVLDNMKVLIVEDHAVSAEVLSEYCRDFNFNVLTAREGTEALAVFNREPDIGLVLMDWKMFGMDGLETARAILGGKSHRRKPRIIMVTCYGREELMNEADRLGLDGFLIKPVSRLQLLEAILNAFGEGSSGKTRAASDIQPNLELRRIRGAHLLLVEDNAINQQVAVELLENEGFTVEVAENGRMAVEILSSRGRDFDLVFMDLQMPVMDGYTATGFIRQIHGLDTLPIVAMTAEAMSGVVESVREAGMNDYLTKPIDVAKLYKTLVTWIQPETVEHRCAAREDSPVSALTDPSPSANLPVIDGLDTADGLRRVAGNRDLYLRLLGQFTASYRDFNTRLSLALEDEDRTSSVLLVHTLKGVAGNLGAAALSREAAQLEYLLKTVSRLDESTLPPRLKTFGIMLDSFVEAIDKAMVTEESRGTETVFETALDMQAVKPLMQRLQKELEQNDTNALSTLEELERLVDGHGVKALHRAVAQQVELFDFDVALDEFQALSSALGAL